MADANVNKVSMTEKQKVKEITDRLEEGLKELFEGEKYKSYLNTMSKFHNYSANNIQLIEMQCPDATYVAGYKAWQRNFERHVNRGERGIRILAPSPYKIKEEQEKIDPVTNDPVLDQDGMPVMEEVEIKIPAFRVITVFDYSQTDGKELSGLGVNELHGDVKRYQDFMEALERVSPVPIRYEEMEGERKGYFIDLSRPIAIKEGMSEVQTAKTGVHEVAHAKLHAREAEQDMEKAVYKDQKTKEVEAESIAYTVCRHFGIDTSDYSFGYIAGWSSGKEMPELKSSLDTIRRTSSELIKGIEAQLLEIEKERAAEQSQEDIILLVSNTGRSEYDLLSVKGVERTDLLNALHSMKDDDRQSVEAYLERAGAWVTLLANERSEEVEEYHLDYAYDIDTHEITDFKALQGHGGLFDVEKGDWWNAYKEYQSMKQELEDSEPNREAQLLYGNEGRYGIYQLKDTEETRDIRFMAMDYLEMKGIPVSRENYTLVYTGELKEGMSLEDIYTKFNIDHPVDFTGHSLSVSDIVMLHQGGENTSYYVDSVGYREIPEFTKELSVSAEISTEKDTLREETAEERTMAEPDNDKVSYYVIEDLSTWAENSPEKSRLERFESLPEAMAKFTEYRGKETEDKPDMARATFGFHVNGSEFDLIHVRNHENCLSLDFTHSKAAEESSRFMEDLQTLNHEVGFDRVRVHREMSPEEVRDFVKQRFEYQLKSSGLDDISLYMDRFDALYGQGKMEHLMPTANQKHIVEDVPFTEWENPYIDTKSQAMGREETELAFRLADRYISIQEVTEGYDYTIYDMNYRELDGGVYDNPDITIRQALDEIVADLKEPMHRSELEGNIHTYDELIPIDYDGLIEKAEQEAKHGIENRIRKEAEERKTVADFKARTEELFHGINGQTQGDIELSVYAYLQSKIDEYGINIELVDVAVSGSRCRGLEKAASDLDVVVEYRGRESEDDLFNAFNEDGFTIGGIKVDINPITEGKTGTLGEYLPGVEAYLAEKRAALQEKAAEQSQEEKQTIVTLTVAECGEFHNFGEYHEGIAGIEEAIAIFNQIPPERMNGIPSIGINIHTEGTECYEDTQMDIVSGSTIDLEMLEYYPEITGNPKALAVISELMEKFPEAEVRGSLEQWTAPDMQRSEPELDADKAALLAAEIDQLSYNYDTVQYRDTVEDRDAQVANIAEDIRNGNTEYLNDFLNAIISDSIREGVTDIFGKGAELNDSKGVQTARKAQKLLDSLAGYEPPAKAEENAINADATGRLEAAAQLIELQQKAAEIARGYEKLPMQDRISIIAQSFGCTSGKIETSPCTGKWRGTSDVSIRFDNGASLFIGNHRTPQAKTAKVQNEFVNSALVQYNPEIIRLTKETAIDALRKREEKDNEIAAEKGLKPYTLLNVEFNDGTDEKNGGYMGWYYVTLAVGGEIRPHIETGLNHEILDGKVSETPTRENYFAAGVLKESDVDYVFNNVGFSSTSGLYSLHISDEVRERAEKTLAERGASQAQEQTSPDELMTREWISTPRGSFSVTAMSREQMETAGYGFHHQSDDGKYLIMGNGKQAFAIAAEPPENCLNADRAGNVPNSGKQTGRISIKEKLAEKKAVIEQKDKSEKEVLEKGTEKKSEREV